MFAQKLHGRMSIGKAEKVLNAMLNVPEAEVVIRNSKTRRDIRDNAKLSSLRRLRFRTIEG